MNERKKLVLLKDLPAYVEIGDIINDNFIVTNIIKTRVHTVGKARVRFHKRTFFFFAIKIKKWQESKNNLILTVARNNLIYYKRHHKREAKRRKEEFWIRNIIKK